MIEDEEEWASFMYDALKEQRKLQTGYDFKVHPARSASEARELIDSELFHVISIDQNIPDKINEPVHPHFGLELTEYLEVRRPFIRKLIYTAYSQIAHSNRAGRFGNTPYYEKSLSQHTDKEKNILSVTDWAAEMVKMGKENRLKFVLQAGEKHLPSNLASLCRAALASESHKIEIYKCYLNIWESALHLAWAQACAICVHAGIQPDIRAGHRDMGSLTRNLKHMIKALAAAGWLGHWPAYLGRGAKGSGERIGARFIDHGCEPLREARNAYAHNFENDEADPALLEAPMLVVMDGLSFWADNPVITDIQYHSTQRDRISFREVRGDRWPWPKGNALFPDLPRLPGHAREHLFIRWRRPDGSGTLIDLHPFACLENRKGEPGKDLWLVFPPSQDNRFERRSLSNGKTEKWDPHGDERQAIESVVQRKSRPRLRDGLR